LGVEDEDRKLGSIEEHRMSSISCYPELEGRINSVLVGKEG